jgi:hypothetical protein
MLWVTVEVTRDETLAWYESLLLKSIKVSPRLPAGRSKTFSAGLSASWPHRYGPESPQIPLICITGEKILTGSIFFLSQTPLDEMFQKGFD